MKTNRSFKDWLAIKGYGKSTIKNYVSIVSNTPELTAYNDLVPHLERLRARLKIGTVNQHITALGHYGDYLKEMGLLDRNFYRKVKIRPGIKGKVNVLEIKELESIHFNLPKQKKHELRDKVLLGLLIYQAADMGSIKYLEKESINLEKGEIYLRGGKRSNSRKLSIHSSQVLSLYRQIEQEEGSYLIKGRLTDHYHHMLKRLGKRNVKLESVRQIRSSVIKSWLTRYNLREVQYYLGHKYISSTERYKEVNLEGLKDEISKYHLVHRG